MKLQKSRHRFQRIRPGLKLCFFLILCGLFAFSVQAEEQDVYEQQWTASQADDVLEALPESTKQLLSDLGIEPESLSSIITLQPHEAAEQLLTIANEKKSTPFAVGGLLIGTILLCTVLDGFRRLPSSPSLTTTYRTAGLLAIATVIFVPLCDCIRSSCEALESTFVFMTSFAPVYTAVLTAAGDPTVALSFQSVVLFVAQVMSGVFSTVVTPLLTVSLGLGTAGSLDDTFPLTSVSRFLHRFCTWTLGLFCTVFVGMLSLQTLVGTRADGVAIRAVRFSLANLVPVIGNAVSEAFGTVQNCLLVLRTTLGGLGTVVTGLMLLPPLVECGWWALLLSLCAAVSDALSFSSLSSVLRLAADVVKTLAGLLICGGLFLIISITVVTMATEGL